MRLNFIDMKQGRGKTRVYVRPFLPHLRCVSSRCGRVWPSKGNDEQPFWWY